MDRIKSLINTLANEAEKGADVLVLLSITEELRTSLQQKIPSSGSRPAISVWMPGGLPKPHVSRPVAVQAVPPPVAAEPAAPVPAAMPAFTALRPPKQILATELPPEPLEPVSDLGIAGNASSFELLAASPAEPISIEKETAGQDLDIEPVTFEPGRSGISFDPLPLPAEIGNDTNSPILESESPLAVDIEEEYTAPEAKKTEAAEPILPQVQEEERVVQPDVPELPSVMELVVDITDEEMAILEEEEKTKETVAEDTLGTARITVEDIWTKAKAAPVQQPPGQELNEKIARRTVALNELFERRSPELVEVLAEPRVNDLRKAISINEKYQYINSLFRGEDDMFERSLKTLNNFGTFPEAQYWMQRELMIKLGWNDEDELVQKFCKLVARRFA